MSLGPDMIRTTTILTLVALLSACGNAGDGKIERLDDAFDTLVARDAKIEKIAEGFQFLEGPLWISEGDYLLFSDIPGNRIIKWSDSDGISTFLEPILAPDANTGAEGGSNGLTLDGTGRLRIAVLNEDMTRSTLADSYGGNRFASPNDVVVHSDGSLYFTDPSYGLPEGDLDPQKQMTWNGVYRLTRNGQVQLLTHQTMPNGLALSPDEKTLYVTNSLPTERTLTAYPVLDGGTLGEGVLLLDMNEHPESGSPDGIKVDNAGNIWMTGPDGVWAIGADGEHLGTIAPDERPANLAFGNDGKTLYMTARTGLYRIRILVEGPIP
jgi:gluconolactonase